MQWTQDDSSLADCMRQIIKEALAKCCTSEISTNYDQLSIFLTSEGAHAGHQIDLICYCTFCYRVLYGQYKPYSQGQKSTVYGIRSLRGMSIP